MRLTATVPLGLMRCICAFLPETLRVAFKLEKRHTAQGVAGWTRCHPCASPCRPPSIAFTYKNTRSLTRPLATITVVDVIVGGRGWTSVVTVHQMRRARRRGSALFVFPAAVCVGGPVGALMDDAAAARIETALARLALVYSV
ncbi:hypothetical protein HPB50_024209 [Hyalomma asiaticum]|uniref:Uncharacterized protein n=1 Tax=Hyalomma asiaticum TaxID=266040 RepID=A0ACB7SQ02_HYAAI|nr:hypothetical protein HPB50_024209 [Hyalomma asiaticum]